MYVWIIAWIMALATSLNKRSQARTTFGDARWADFEEDRQAMGDVLASRGIYLGFTWATHTENVTALHYGGPRHLLTVAPNRSGKGTCAIIPNLLLLDHSVLIIDPKGENAAITARQRRTFGNVYLLNPFNEHGLGTARFNPLACLSIHHPNVVADIGSLAEALIVDSGKGEPHWPDSARALIKTLLLHLLATKGSNATLGDMRRLLTQGEREFLTTIYDMTQSRYGFIRQPAAQFGETTDEMKSIISTARTQTAFLDDPPIAHTLSGSDFSMLDLKRATTSVYVILPSRYLVAYANFFRLVVVSALDQLQSRPGGVKTTFFLDEFAALGRLSAIETAFGQAAGFNVQLWPFLQDLNQLRSIYKEKWETFIANAGVVRWFTPNDAFTADYLSRRLGQMTAQSHSTSSNTGGTNASSSNSYGEVGVPFQSVADLYGLSDTAAINTLSGLKYGVLSTRKPYYFDPDVGEFPRIAKPLMQAVKAYYKAHFEGRYDANPFHGSAAPTPAPALSAPTPQLQPLRYEVERETGKPPLVSWWEPDEIKKVRGVETDGFVERRELTLMDYGHALESAHWYHLDQYNHKIGYDFKEEDFVEFILSDGRLVDFGFSAEYHAIYARLRDDSYCMMAHLRRDYISQEDADTLLGVISAEIGAYITAWRMQRSSAQAYSSPRISPQAAAALPSTLSSYDFPHALTPPAGKSKPPNG